MVKRKHEFNMNKNKYDELTAKKIFEMSKEQLQKTLQGYLLTCRRQSYIIINLKLELNYMYKKTERIKKNKDKEYYQRIQNYSYTNKKLRERIRELENGKI